MAPRAFVENENGDEAGVCVCVCVCLYCVYARDELLAYISPQVDLEICNELS